MPKARLYFDGDNTGIEKNARTYSLTQSVEDAIDSIPGVVDNTTSTSTTDALSANMGRDLQEQINNLAARGRYLSTWNAATGLPDTNPQVSPYAYRAGDYYVVSTVGTTNYRPHGSSYTIGVASTDVELETLNVNDLYIYDGTQWIRQGSSIGTSVAWGTIIGNIANQSDLQNALGDKANLTDVLTKTNTTSYTPSGDYNPATKKYVDDNKGAGIEYVTQAEYTALLPGAESDGKHYFIYTSDSPTPPVLNERPDLDQYSLLSSATLTGFSNPGGIFVSEDGTKLFVGPQGGSIHQYTMTGGLLSNISAVESTSSSTGTQGLFCKPDGTELYSTHTWNKKWYTITMSTPYSLTGSSFDSGVSVIGSQEPSGCWFTPNGDYIFVVDGGGGSVGSQGRNNIYKVPLTTAWDVSSATSTGLITQYLYIGDEQRLFNIAISPTGLKMFVSGWGATSCYITQYNLSTPWDITTATTTGKRIGTRGCAAFSVSGDGNIFVADTTVSTPIIYQYTVS